MVSDSTTEVDLGPIRHHITIRDLEIDDLAAVYHLGESVFTRSALPVLYRTWDPFEVTTYYNTDPEFCLVAENEDGELVGFALGTTVDKDGPCWRYGYLAWLGVKREYQRHGVARRLLREFEKRMKEEGVRMLLVDTEGDNAPALEFFQRNGFNHPVNHVWLSKSLVRREPGAIKPMKPVLIRTPRRTSGGKRGAAGGTGQHTLAALAELTSP